MRADARRNHRRILAAAMTELQDSAQSFEDLRVKLLGSVEILLDRAERGGAIRTDIELADILGVIGMTHAVALWTGPVDPDNWRRYLALLLNGMRTVTEPELPLRPPPLTVDQMNAARVVLVRRTK